MGVIHTDTNPSKYSDLHDKRYYISYDELAENWKENFKAKCDGTWAVADKQNKCPPSEDIGTIDTDIYTWTFNFGSAPKPTGITSLNYPDNDYVEPNNVGQHWKIRIFLYMKNYISDPNKGERVYEYDKFKLSHKERYKEKKM